MIRRPNKRHFSAWSVAGATARGILKSRDYHAMVLQRPAEARENHASCQGICGSSQGMAYSKRKTCLTFGGQLVNCPKKDLHCAATFLRSYKGSPIDLSSSRAQVMLVLCPGIAEVDMVTVLRTDSGLSSLIGCGACSVLPACAHVRISRAWLSWVRAG